MSLLHDAALAYVRQGIPVFPLRPGSKIPLPGSQGFKDASTDEYQVDDWWGEGQSYNIGIPTGVVFDVVDLDGFEGVETFEEWCDTADYPTGPAVLTPSGGQHLWVAVTGEGNRAGMLPKVDFRGLGGYVVAPPSTVDGKPYQWLSAGPDDHLLSFLPVASPKVRELISKPSPAPLPVPAPPSLKDRLLKSVQPLGRDSSGYGATALDAECDLIRRTTEGGRNHALNKGAFAVYQLVKGGELDYYEATNQLAEAARSTGLPEWEIDLALNSAWKAAPIREVVALDEWKARKDAEKEVIRIAPFDPDEEMVEDEEYLKFYTKMKTSIRSAEELEDMPNPEPLIGGGRLPMDTLALMWGAPGTKKSFSALDMAMSVAAGKWWHGHSVPSLEGVPVCYFVGEGLAGMKARAEAWKKHYNLHVPKCHFVGMGFNMMDANVQSRVAVNIARELAAKLIVIDTLNRHSLGADELSSKDWGKLIATAEELRLATGACVLIIHHSNAGGERERGHTSLFGAVDTSIKVVSDSGGSRTTLEWKKAKDSPPLAPIVLFTTPVEGTNSIILGDTYVAEAGEVEDRLNKKVQSALEWVGATGATENELLANLGEDPWEVKKSLTDLQDAGTVIKKGQRFYPYYGEAKSS